VLIHWALYARQIEPTVKRLSARLESQDDASSGQLPPDGLFKVVFAESHFRWQCDCKVVIAVEIVNEYVS
jgi:hypothetical protein